jgi:hypothetical protein
MKLRELASAVTVVTGGSPDENRLFANRVTRQADRAGLAIVETNGRPTSGHLAALEAVVHLMPHTADPIGLLVFHDFDRPSDETADSLLARADLLSILCEAPKRGHGVLVVSEDPDLLYVADHVATAGGPARAAA